MPTPSLRLFEIEQLREEIRRLLDVLDVPETFTSAGEWVPPVDICETDDALLVRADVPGLDAGSVEISIVGSLLKIAGRKPDERTGCPVRFHCAERAGGAFTRIVRLSRVIDAPRARARLAGGVLTVHIPKRPDRSQVEVAVPVEEVEP